MFHATELYGQNDRLFRTVPVRSPTSTAPLRAGQGDLTACRRAGLPVRPRPAASCQPDRVEERHPLRRDQDRPLQAQDARLLACISTRILSVPYDGGWGLRPDACQDRRRDIGLDIHRNQLVRGGHALRLGLPEAVVVTATLSVTIESLATPPDILDQCHSLFTMRSANSTMP